MPIKLFMSDDDVPMNNKRWNKKTYVISITYLPDKIKSIKIIMTLDLNIFARVSDDT